MQTVGERLKEALFMRGLTASELCRLTNIERGHISNIITGRIQHPKKHLNAIAQALEISELWLLTGSGETEHIEIEYEINGLIENKLGQIGLWKTDLKICKKDLIIIHNNTIHICKNDLMTGNYLFLKNGEIEELYRIECLTDIKWYPNNITKEMECLGRIHTKINIGLIKNENIDIKRNKFR